MTAKRILHQVPMVVALVCMVITTAAVAKREFFPSRRPSAAPASQRVPDWEKYLSAGVRIGREDAPVTILEFGDFQCPACRQFAVEAWPRLRKTYGDSVSLVFRHWPLPYHRAAYSAAVAAECAGKQGRFEAFHDVLFARQDSIELKPMVEFASVAGVPNVQEFEECVSRPQPVETIEADIAAAKEVGGTGTPTLVINGIRYRMQSDRAWLSTLVDSLLRSARTAKAVGVHR